MIKNKFAGMKKYGGLLLVFALLLLMALPVPVGAVNGTEVSIPDANAEFCNTVQVAINITDVVDLAAASIWLVYDSTVVEVTAVADGDLGGITYNIDNANSTTKMNWFLAAGKTGDWTFAKVTLHAVGSAGETSPLTLDVRNLVDKTIVPIPHATVNGTFTVAGAETYDLTISSTPGGSVTTPGEGTFTGYTPGEVQNLVAAANLGWEFDVWTGDTGTIGDVNVATTYIDMYADYNITANFIETPVVEYWLTIDTDGCGDVTNPGEGTFGPYSPGDTQSLVADPCDCWAFNMWDGDWTTIANRYDPTTTITMNGDYDITAVFSLIEEGGLFPDTVMETLWPDDCITVLKRVEIAEEDNFDGVGGPVYEVRLEVVTSGFEDWVMFYPPSRSYSPPCDVVYFDEEICVPPGTQPGRYTFFVKALGAYDQEFGKQEVTINVPREVKPVRAPAVVPAAADLASTNLHFSHEQVVPGQQVEISINIGNDGGSVGTRTVTLTINGYVEDSQTVSVSPGSSKLVVFRVTEDEPGTYQVLVEGKEGVFYVLAPQKASYFSGPMGTGGIIVIVVVAIVLIVAVVFVFRKREQM